MDKISTLTSEQQQLYQLIISANKEQTAEIKSEFKEIAAKTETTQKEVEVLKQKYLTLERNSRKNNVVIFGLKNTETTNDNLSTILNQLNGILGTNIKEGDINNFYPIGKSQNRPLILQFISFLRKRTLFKNKDKLKLLKVQGLSISNDLCPEDRAIQRTLHKHLKIAKSQDLNAKIVGQKLLIDHQEYDINNLKALEEETENKQSAECSSSDDLEEEEGFNPPEDISKDKTRKPSTSKPITRPVVQTTSTTTRNRMKVYNYSPKNTRAKKK